MDNTVNEIKFTDGEIFTKMWTMPRKVFKYINEHRYDKYVVVLLFLAGISRSFDNAILRSRGDELPLYAIIGLCIVFGGLLGWLSYYLYAALISWTGSWFNGKGDTKSILRIIAYAMTPSIIALVLLIPQIIVYDIEIFKSDGDTTSGGTASNIIYNGSMLLEFIYGIFTLIFVVIGVSEVQKLSIGKTILNLILPIIIIVVPLLIIAFFFLAF